MDENTFPNRSIFENLQKVLQEVPDEEILSQPNSADLLNKDTQQLSNILLAHDEIKNKQQPLQKQHVQSKNSHQNLPIQNVQQYLQQFFPTQYMAAHNIQHDLQTQHMQTSLPMQMRNVPTQMHQMPTHMHVPTHPQSVQLQQHIQWHQQMKGEF